MSKIFFTIIILFILSISLIAGKLETQKPYIPTDEDDTRLIEQVKNATSTLPLYKLPNELGRTWYDYACNNNPGRTVAHAYGTGTDGIHFGFMKIAIDGAERYVTYDYWDTGFGFFFGNQSIDETLGRTGWGRVVNGKDDEAIISHHGGGSHLWQDASESGFSFTKNSFVTNGLFPGVAVMGDTVVMISNLDGANYTFLPNDIQVSTDYMQSFTAENLWPLEPLATTYGPTEMWPTFNSNGDMTVLYDPDATAANPNGEVKIATTSDLCATWTTMLVWGTDVDFPVGTFLPGKTSNLASPWQYFSMYGNDDTYHCVFGGIQGVADNPTATQLDYFPILYWNTRDQQFMDLAFTHKSNPVDTATVPNLLVNSRSGNSLGGLNYPILSEGPNGEMVCIWQEWEDDGTGHPVMATPTGGAADIFCTDIWGAYSHDAGMTWSDPFFVVGTPGESDMYPYITKNFGFNTAEDSLVLDIAYLWDTNIGGSVVGAATPASECVWFYEQIVVEVPPPSGIEDEIIVVQEFKLTQNYPNPFNPVTTIKFNVEKATDIKLDVFNVSGEKVATLFNGRVSAAGEQTASFDGTNFASGVYFYQLTSGKFVQTRKMLLVK